jgi:transglutaminase-like putative cysteine protease
MKFSYTQWLNAVAVTCGWLLLAQPSSAQTTPTPAAHVPNATFIRDHTHYNLQSDGRYTMDKDMEWRLNTPQAVQQMGQLPLAFSTSLQSIDVLEAYTVTPEGKRVDVRSDGIREQLFPASSGAPMFDDRRVKTLVFPSLSVGARLVMRTRMTMKEALFPGQVFEFTGAFPPFDRQSFEVSVQAPADMKVKLTPNKMEGGEENSDNPAVRRWRWHQSNLPALVPEMGAASPHGDIPHVALTTFDSDAQIAQAYWARAQDKVKVTAEVQKLANKLTQGIPDRRAQAEVLYRWVSKNIRYVAIYLGFGGVVPHSADEVIQAGYGDCKDKSTLLSALLAAKGISSQSALVNATDVYWMPAEPMPTTVFNHLITYLPEWDMFVDPTPDKASFGVLSSALAGKKALILGQGDQATMLRTLPLHQPSKDFVFIKTEMTLSSNGKVEGSSEIQSGGSFDLLARTVMASLPPGMEPQIASQLMALSGQQGTGNLRHYGAEDTDKPFKYITYFTLPDLVQLPGPGAMAVPVGLPGLVYLAGVFRPLALTERRTPLVFAGGRITEHITLKLPADMPVQKMPPPVTFSNALASYASSMEQQGQVIHIKRQLDVQLLGPTVSGEDYLMLRQTATQVVRDLRTQLIY